MKVRYVSHYKRNIRLALPLMITQLGHPLVGFSSAVIIGHFAGTLPLAGLALANGYFNLLMIIGIGIAYGLTPLIAKADGSDDRPLCGKLLSHSLVVNLLMGLILGAAAFIGGVFVFGRVGQRPEVIDQARPLLYLLGISLFPLMIFLTFKQFVEGLGQTRQAMNISLWGNAINIVVGIVLVKGLLGIRPMGIAGVGYAAIADRTIMAIAMGAYALRNRRTRPFIAGFSLGPFQSSLFKMLLGTGLPISLQYIFEFSAFTTAVFMTGWLGAAQLAAYQAALVMVSLLYYTAGSFGTSAAISTGYFTGRRSVRDVRMSGIVNYHLAIGFHFLTGLALFVFRYPFARIFSADHTVIDVIANLLIFTALFEVFDGLQITGLGILRGMGDHKAPTWITLVAYWAFAMPLAWALGLHTDLGVYGIWIGLYCGLFIASAGLYWRFAHLSKQAYFFK